MPYSDPARKQAYRQARQQERERARARRRRNLPALPPPLKRAERLAGWLVEYSAADAERIVARALEVAKMRRALLNTPIPNQRRTGNAPPPRP